MAAAAVSGLKDVKVENNHIIFITNNGTRLDGGLVNIPDNGLKQYNSRTNFPAQGNDKNLYFALDDKKLYIYNRVTKEYEIIQGEAPEDSEEPDSEATAELEEDIISNADCGAAPSNTLFSKGLSFTEFAKKILIKEIAPAISFSASNTGVKEIGTSVTSTTLTLNINNKNSGTPVKIKFYVGDNLVSEQNYTNGKNSYTYSYNTPITATTKVKGILEYNQSTGASKTLQGTADFTFVYASYYGVTSLEPSAVTSNEVLGKTKNLSTSKGYTQNNITLRNQRIIYAYPKSYGNLSKIVDGNNFDVTDSFTRLDMNLNNVAYNVYVLQDPTTDSGIKIIYS